MTISYISTTQNRRLAYRQHKGEPGKACFVWLSGFKSDMTGSKVTVLEAWAKAEGHSFLAFDYSGHGQSDGDFKDGTISQWREDTLAAIDTLTTGPQILIGSSMGGWMALLAAIARPQRVSGLVLIAPAPDFTEKLMWPGLLPEEKKEILQNGIYYQPSEYDEPLPLTKALFEDGKNWQIMDQPIPFSGPVRILQGMQDEPVPWAHAQSLVDLITSQDLTFTLIKDGDHRLSREQDIARLIATCGEMGATA